MTDLPLLTSPDRSLPAQPRRPEGLAQATRRAADLSGEVCEPLLPDTLHLLRRLAASDTLDAASEGCDASVAFYRAQPEASTPFLRLRISEAADRLLVFLGLPEAGFEVLQAHRAGFQYHWRSDLVRAYDEAVPILGRLHLVTARDEAVVEHLAVPVVTRHRVREVRGWFVFDRDEPVNTGREDSLVMVRRPLRSRLERLPSRLWHPDRKVSPVEGALSMLHSRHRRRRRH